MDKNSYYQVPKVALVHTGSDSQIEVYPKLKVILTFGFFGSLVGAFLTTLVLVFNLSELNIRTINWLLSNIRYFMMGFIISFMVAFFPALFTGTIIAFTKIRLNNLYSYLKISLIALLVTSVLVLFIFVFVIKEFDLFIYLLALCVGVLSTLIVGKAILPKS